ncbi:MAG TPA: hypothetical protein EYP98_15075 [Planctomycetes bacterium]|nr:hypothetical protein [Planctomycetota bacterium]
MSNPSELARLRTQMDAVNQRLTDVLHERADPARQIGVVKRAAGMTATDPDREQTMLTAMMGDTPTDGFSKNALEVILRAVLHASRAVVASPNS